MNSKFTPFSEAELRSAIEVSAMNNPLCMAVTLLSDSEVRALKTLASRQGGAFTLRRLYGDYWHAIRGPRKFGRRVRASLIAGYLPGLREVGKKSKSYVYVSTFAPSESLVPAQSDAGKATAVKVNPGHGSCSQPFSNQDGVVHA